MADLKKVWRQTAKSFVLAFNDLGISVADTVKAGVDIAVEWAKKDNPHVQAEGTEVPCEEAVADAAEEVAEKVEDAAEKAADKAADAAEKAADKAADVAEKVADKAADVAEKVADKAKK